MDNSVYKKYSLLINNYKKRTKNKLSICYLINFIKPTRKINDPEMIMRCGKVTLPIVNVNLRKEKSDPIGSPSRIGKTVFLDTQFDQEAINYTGSNVSNVVSKRMRASVKQASLLFMEYELTSLLD
ncbi:hypothetical protein [Vibrio azureus]|uniref:hypothetical protein n=1 Tax=Vibrio azureus TaxID=512649 RepID=UPI001D10524A|nr:hypothetical protein [Vibrio azureus]